MNLFNNLESRGTNLKTEIYAGLTTFLTMAYILAVNPDILSISGMDKGAVFTATALAAVVGTLAMAFLADYPFVLAPGMGLNAYFAFTVAMEFGWQVALLAVFIEGIIFILLSFINVREAIFDAIPISLKHGISVGIGLFITFIGFQNAGIIVDNPATLVGLGNIKSVTVILALIGLVITTAMCAKQIKGAIFWGILITYVMGIVCQLTGFYVPNPEIGMFSLIPYAIVSAPPSISGNTIFDAFAYIKENPISISDLAIAVFAFLFVDLFDTIGTLVGVSSKAELLDEDGKLPKAKQALLADAIGTTFGACVGTSTVTTFVESASGVAEGGRTGVTALVSAGLFALSLFFAPIFIAIPAFATAPALIIVGFYMLQSVVKIDFEDMTEAVPAFLAVVFMPLTYSISDGIVFGFLGYVLIKLFAGKSKDVTPVMWIVSVLFLAKLFLM